MRRYSFYGTLNRWRFLHQRNHECTDLSFNLSPEKRHHARSRKELSSGKKQRNKPAGVRGALRGGNSFSDNR